MSSQLANVALQLIANVSVQATDQNLQAVTATRNMLTQIANGTLVVTNAVPQAQPEDVPPPAEDFAARRRDRHVVGKVLEG